MAKFTIDVLIKGSTNMAKVAKDFTKSTKKIGAAIAATTVGVTANKKAFASAGVAADRLSRTLGIGLVAAFAAVTIAGAGFEVAVADLSALTGITGQGLDTLSDAAIEMSKTYGTSASKVAEATKLVASAKSELIGVDGALEKVTKSAIILGKASRVDLATSTKVLTTAMNQFNLGAEEADRVINVLAVGAKLGASEIADTGQAILRAGVAARVAGVSFEETQAAIQVLAKGGLKGVIAGTQLKTMLLRMMASADIINPKIVGMSKAFENLAAAELTGAQYSHLFGLEAMTAGIIITENRLLMDKWTESFTGTQIAHEQAAKNMATLTEAGKRLGAAITVHLIAAFNKYGPALSRTVDKMAKFLNIMSKPPNKAVAVAVWVLGAALTFAAGSFALLLIQFQIFRAIGWFAAIKPALSAVYAFNLAVQTGFIGALRQGIAIVVLWASTLWTTAVPAISAGASAAWTLAAGVLAATWPILLIIAGLAAMVALIVVVVKHWDSWGASLAILWGPLGLIISGIIEFKNHWSDVVNAFKTGGIKGAILAIGKVITIAILRPMEQLLNLIAKIPGLGGAGDLADKLGAMQSGLFPEGNAQSLTDQAAASSSTIIHGNRQQLDVKMKIDSEGRPAIEKAESDTSGLIFSADLGFTNAIAGAI